MIWSANVSDCHLREVPASAHLLHRQLEGKTNLLIVLDDVVDRHLPCFLDKSESLVNSKKTFHVNDSLVVIEDATYARYVLFKYVRDIVYPQVLFSEFLPPQLLAKGQEVSHKNHFKVLSKALL